MVVLTSFLAIGDLMVVYLFCGELRFLDGAPRSIRLSMTGGLYVACVFVCFLPELAESQETIAER